MTQETDPDLPVHDPEGVGQWWPAAGLGALSVAVLAWDLLKEAAIIFTTSSSLLLLLLLSHFSRVRLFATPWTVALQAPLSVGFSIPTRNTQTYLVPQGPRE